MLAGAVVATAVAARAAGVASSRIAGAELAFVSLVAESIPFLLAGALLAALLRGRVGTRMIGAAGRRPRLAAALAPFAGTALPLCDCGLLPIARQLRDAGGGRAVGPFLAGAPLTNPIVIVSTLLAFPGRPGMVVARVAGGIAIAMVVAALVLDAPAAAGPETDCSHDQGGTAPGPARAVAAELTHTAPTLVLGALAAASVKALVPTAALTALADQPLLGAVAMIALAFVMSICSQADAFVAAALPVGPLPRLAFLLVGPTLDLRLAALYRREFGLRWVARYAAVVVPAALVVATACATAGLL